jgi:predicted lipoprotein
MNPQHQHEFKNGVLRGLIWVLLAGLLLVIANLASAETKVDRSSLLFPYYETDDVLGSVAMHHYAKDTAVLSGRLDSLNKATTQFCAGNSTREHVKTQYAKAYLAWLELSAVVMGPMLEHNTVRQIDFRPGRINLLERAISKQPKGAQAMALVGSPAKGFPAIEYLLMHAEFKANTPQCIYAQEVVQDIARTVEGLSWQPFNADMPLYFNQLVGATHNLAWERMEKPLLKFKDQVANRDEPVWPFTSLGLTEQAWAAQWRGIAELLVVHTEHVPAAETGVVPLEAYLRGLGKIDLADALVKHHDLASAAILDIDADRAASVEQAVSATKALKNFLETEVAKGLKVSIQFSSSDGD